MISMWHCHNFYDAINNPLSANVHGLTSDAPKDDFTAFGFEFNLCSTSWVTSCNAVLHSGPAEVAICSTEAHEDQF